MVIIGPLLCLPDYVGYKYTMAGDCDKIASSRDKM